MSESRERICLNCRTRFTVERCPYCPLEKPSRWEYVDAAWAAIWGWEGSRRYPCGAGILMTIAELKDRIEAIPPGSQVPRDWLLDQLNEMPEANYGSMTWATIEEAAQITGLSETRLRAKAPGWASYNRPRDTSLENESGGKGLSLAFQRGRL